MILEYLNVYIATELTYNYFPYFSSLVLSAVYVALLVLAFEMYSRPYFLNTLSSIPMTHLAWNNTYYIN